MKEEERTRRDKKGKTGSQKMRAKEEGGRGKSKRGKWKNKEREDKRSERKNEKKKEGKRKMGEEEAERKSREEREEGEKQVEEGGGEEGGGIIQAGRTPGRTHNEYTVVIPALSSNFVTIIYTDFHANKFITNASDTPASGRLDYYRPSRLVR